MIVTGKKRVPFLWLLLALLPWTAVLFKFYVMNNAFTFSLMKYIENPAGLAFVLSLPSFISIVVRPFVNFKADRIWTRFGRRKPFIVVSWIGILGSLFIMPLMPNFWLLIAAFLCYQFFNDIGDPIEQLKLEVVPPPQRGTSAAINTWILNISNMTFSFVALGRFDDYKFMAGVPITGEQSLYWSAALAVASMFLLVTLGIKETDPHSSMLGERFSFANFFGGILSRHLFPVYLLIFAWQIFNSGLYVINTLLMIEQWGFTKQEMGTNMAVGGTLNIFIISGIIFVADRLDRAKWFFRLIGISALINIAYYVYIEYVLYDGTPILFEVIFFGETLSIIGILLGVMYVPLVYDFVKRNEMGTYMAGASLLGRITSVITLNGIGIFAWLWAVTFMPPGGEMTRIVLSDNSDEARVRQLLADHQWNDPQTGAPCSAGQISASAWYATNATLKHGRAFEIRLKNDDSVSLRAKREALAAECSTLEADQAYARALSRTTEVEQLTTQIAPLNAQIKKLDDELAARAAAFRQQLVQNLGPHLITPGEQILAAAPVDMLLVELRLSAKPQVTLLEKILNRLRTIRPQTIDLRPGYQDGHYLLHLSALRDPASDPQKQAADLLTAVADAADDHTRTLFTQPLVARSVQDLTGVSLDVLIVEDPLNRHPSPLSHVWNAMLGLFADVPGPDRRILALGRALRSKGAIEHVRVTTVEGNDAAIRVIALPGTATPDSTTQPTTDATEIATQPATDTTKPATTTVVTAADNAAATERLNTLLASNTTLAHFADTVYRRLLSVGADQRMTVARPVVAEGYVPLKYDYMAGYVWFFSLQIVAFIIIYRFQRAVKLGRIHRRGVEEMEATE